jgi:hypothetical protein
MEEEKKLSQKRDKEKMNFAIQPGTSGIPSSGKMQAKQSSLLLFY